MTNSPPPPAWTIRDLPLPAKLVLTCFLFAVGLGYFSAMVQLHLQHSSRDGEPLPSPANVVEIFSGLKKADPNAPIEVPASKLEKLILGPIEGAPWSGSGSMAAAFFHKDGADYRQKIKDAPTEKAKLDAEREGERTAVVAWIRAPEDQRKSTYVADNFPLPENRRGQPITAEYVTDKAASLKIKTLIDARCSRCHSKGEEQEQYPLDSYDALAKYLIVPTVVAPIDGWVRSEKQIGIEKLTQSTHAHLLSFAMLFSLTGLIFALTGYPMWVRCLVAPLALLAEVCDVSCWWLARLEHVGPYFALAIIAAGTVGGLTLVVQILGSVFAMYHKKGRFVLALVILAAAGLMGLLGVRIILPALEAEKAIAANVKIEVAIAKAEADDQQLAPPINPRIVGEPKVKLDHLTRPAPPDVPSIIPAPQAPKPAPVSHLEKLIMGPRKGTPWNADGSMGGAFFEKDKAFKEIIATRPPAEVEAEREGERLALQAWLNLAPDARKKVYTDNALSLAKDRVGKPITPIYLTADKTTVKVKSILTDRCVRCHSAEGDTDGYPLETYEQLSAYFGPVPK